MPVPDGGLGFDENLRTWMHALEDAVTEAGGRPVGVTDVEPHLSLELRGRGDLLTYYSVRALLDRPVPLLVGDVIDDHTLTIRALSAAGRDVLG